MTTRLFSSISATVSLVLLLALVPGAAIPMVAQPQSAALAALALNAADGRAHGPAVSDAVLELGPRSPSFGVNAGQALPAACPDARCIHDKGSGSDFSDMRRPELPAIGANSPTRLAFSSERAVFPSITSQDSVSFTTQQITHGDVSSRLSGPFSLNLDSDDNTHFIFKKDDHIYYMNDLEGTWQVPISVTSGSGYSRNPGGFELDDTGYAYVTYCEREYDDHGNLASAGGIYYINNTTGDFDDRVLVSGALENVLQHPRLRLDSDGYAHIIFASATDSIGIAARLYYTNNRGGAFVSPILVEDRYLHHAAGKFALEVDSSGTVHAFTINDNSSLEYWYGNEQGFTGAVLDSNDTTGRMGNLFSAIDEDDDIHVVYRNDDLYYLRGREDSFSSPLEVADLWNAGYPIAIDIGRRGVHISYSDYICCEGYWNLNYINSLSGEFSEPTTITTTYDAGASALEVDQAGHVRVLYSAREWHSDSAPNQAFYATSIQSVDIPPVYLPLVLLGCCAPPTDTPTPTPTSTPTATPIPPTSTIPPRCCTPSPPSTNTGP